MRLKTDMELWKIARDMRDGKIFSSGNIMDPADFPIVFSIFAPFIRMSHLERAETFETDVYVIYEYMDRAIGHTHKGYPQFLTMNVLCKEESDVVEEFFQDLGGRIIDGDQSEQRRDSR